MGTKDKTKKFRGSRTCGGGTHKNRRGAGNRGGRGHAGGCKHHFVKELKLGRGYGA
ncbi:MAG: 50S ribosomal protein L15, partial [Halobacteriota archaeon]